MLLFMLLFTIQNKTNLPLLLKNLFSAKEPTREPPFAFRNKRKPTTVKIFIADK